MSQPAPYTPTRLIPEDPGSDGVTQRQEPPKEVQRIECSGGHFSVLRDLGVGGMGVVSLAWQSELCRYVALKRALHDTAALQSVLLREAQIMAQLDHPNIVPMHAMFQHDRLGYVMVMKYVNGNSWKQSLYEHQKGASRGASRAEWVLQNVEILIQVCNAIRFAHNRGIIHRDLKPENVMLGGFGEVFVMDWGLAAELSARPTTEEVIGTLAYLPPEMASIGAAQGVATDVYMLGGCLMEALLLRTPHIIEESQDLEENTTKIRKNALPEFPLGIPTMLVEICQRACAQRPEDRYESAARFQEELQLFVRTFNAQIRLDSARSDLARVVSLPAAAQRDQLQRTAAQIQQAQDLAGDMNFILKESWEVEEIRLERLLNLGDIDHVRQQFDSIHARGGRMPRLAERLEAAERARRRNSPTVDDHLRRTARSRAMGIGFFTFCIALVSIQFQPWTVRTPTYTALIESHALLMVVMVVISLYQRRIWLQNPIGQKTSVIAWVCMLGLLCNRVWGWRVGTPEDSTLGVDMLITAFGTSANILLSLRFWSTPIPFFVGWLAMLAWPQHTFLLFMASLVVGTAWIAAVYLYYDPPNHPRARDGDTSDQGA